MENGKILNGKWKNPQWKLEIPQWKLETIQ